MPLGAGRKNDDSLTDVEGKLEDCAMA